MSDGTDRQVLAIDGGGTRCRIALVRGAERVQVETGPANAYSDFDGAVRSIEAALALLAERSGVSVAGLSGLPGFAGLAGVISAEIADRLSDALPFRRMRYADDRHSALRGALGAQDGMIAHCGTGSFLGVQKAGQGAVFGGWGVLLGDEASAQWIGRKALGLSLHCLDGFAAPSGVSAALLDRFGDATGVLTFAAQARAADFGALAPVVTELAVQGDAAAMRLMQQGAEYVADGLNRMQWSEGLPICLTGGIGPSYARFLPNNMQAAVVPPQGSPMDGAIALAFET